MNIAADQFLMLLQWMDSAFPTGAFAHSGGLETYTQAELVHDADTLLSLIKVKLQALANTDLIIVHIAHDAYGQRDDLEKLASLDSLCAASKVASESRLASEKIGRRMLDNVLNLHTDERLLVYRRSLSSRSSSGHHAVVHGFACAAMGLERRAALLAFAYGMVANQTSASLKLMSIGQTQAQAVLGAAHPAIQDAVDSALTRSLEEFGSFTPALDIRAMQHETLFRRLFIS